MISIYDKTIIIRHAITLFNSQENAKQLWGKVERKESLMAHRHPAFLPLPAFDSTSGQQTKTIYLTGQQSRKIKNMGGGGKPDQFVY